MTEEADIQAQERVGSVLNDKWTLERVLGIGGMAAVYAARHRNGARAAVKVLHAELSRHAEVRERFLREGYAANKVAHPGVVKVLDDDVITAGPDSGTAYLVMELLEGESLQERLERSPPMGEQEFLAIAESVLDVLEAAHARGVVHRDLKPENLFLLGAQEEDGSSTASPLGSPHARAAWRGRVKVLDFGLARLLQGQAITSYGLALGTPSFMSPEQAAGRIDEIDGRTDLFALAATGFRLRTGRRIQEGVNAVELVTKMASVAAPRIRALAPAVSEPFARVIDRALEFRREDRYESAAAMRVDVRRALAELAGAQAEGAALPIAAPSAEATIEASERDFEPLPAAEPAGAFGLGPAHARQRAASSEESIKIPRRRPMLPWVALLLAGGVGAKLLFDVGKPPTTVSGPREPPADVVATPSRSGSPSDGQATDADPTVDVARSARETIDAASPAPLVGPPSASTRRRPSPTIVGPGVHKLPAVHHVHHANTKSTH